MFTSRQKIYRSIQIASVVTVLTLGLGADSWVQQQAFATRGNQLQIAQKPSTTPEPANNVPRLLGKATVVITVNNAPIVIEVDGTNAPITAGNFVDLVQRKVYDGVVFHRVVKEPKPFVVQGGDPQSKNPKVPVESLGTGSWTDPATGKIRYVPLEIKPTGASQPVYNRTLSDAGISKPPILGHKRGAVAMARASDPNSASSQFYFALDNLAFLDGQYAVFAYVTKGMNVVDKIKQGDRIQSAKVIKGLENLKKKG